MDVDVTTELARARAYYEDRRLAEALEIYRRLDAVRPAIPTLPVNAALLLLTAENYRDGFALWERRPEGVRGRGTAANPWPLWDGGRLDGRRILLHAEQGLGDTVQFARYATLVAGTSGGSVVLGVHDALAELAATVPGVARVARGGETLAGIACRFPLQSLAWRFGTTADTVPAAVPYLAPPSDLVRVWSNRLAAVPRPRIGLCWRGRTPADKSLPLATLLAAVEGLAAGLVGVQVGTGRAELATTTRPVFDAGALIAADGRGLAGTAAAIATLDLVVSVDTAVAHLTGALGRPGVVVLKWVADWRWGLDGDTTPWYPTLRLARQPRRGDWPGAAAAVRRIVAAALGG